MKDALLAVLACALLGACASTPIPAREPVDESQPAPPPMTAAILPANTHLAVELNAGLSAETSRRGDIFTVAVTDPLIAQNRVIVVPAGTVITGMVTGVSAAGADTPAAIRLNFLRISIAGVTHPLSATVVRALLPGQTEPVEETGGAPSTAAGSVIGGELRDALAASLGAGAGTIISLGTSAEGGALPAGTRLTIRTRDTLELR
jgi:hypothetical protein